MAEDMLVAAFDTHMKSTEETKAWLQKLYVHPEYNRVFLRPVLGMLITACDFLITNLREIKSRRIT